MCSGRNIDVISIKKFIENKKGILSKDWMYKNNTEKFQVICERGHLFYTCWDVVRLGHWCPYCVGLALDKDYIVKTIKEKGGLLKSDWQYKNSSTKFFITCSKGHNFLTSWGLIKEGCWCPDCLNKSQVEFKNIIEIFFDKQFPTVWPKWLLNRNNARLQLDGYNEELKIAFEYQGYQHYMPGWFDKRDKDSFNHRVNNDIDKLSVCKKMGVCLIIVPYYLPKDLWIDLIKCIVQSHGVLS